MHARSPLLLYALHSIGRRHFPCQRLRPHPIPRESEPLVERPQRTVPQIVSAFSVGQWTWWRTWIARLSSV
ncbi:hypothetical protein BDV11DRAFT_6439 [Aspergillus similis]